MRRSAVPIGAIVCALLVAIFTPSAQALTPDVPIVRFAPPTHGIILTRTLIRGLPDGKSIVTKRSWRLRFVEDGRGFRVEGDLVASTVDAPREVAAIAELERTRPDSGLFPFLIDSQGVIIADPTAASDDAPVVREGMALALSQIGHSNLPVVQRNAAASSLKHVEGALSSYRSGWPADIFVARPFTSTQESESQPTDGPGGTTTTTRTVIRPTEDALAGLRITREVKTQIAGTQRITREEFSFDTPEDRSDE